MTQKWNLSKGLVMVLMMVEVVAYVGVTHPPQDLVPKNDHAGLETWYVKEAADLRQRAKDMMVIGPLGLLGSHPQYFLGFALLLSGRLPLIPDCQISMIAPLG